MSFLFLDIETMRYDLKSKKPDYFRDKIATVQFLTEDGDFYIIKGEELADLPAYQELFESFTVVGHNIGFDCAMLKQQYGVNIQSVYDTMIAELTIFGGPAPADSFVTEKDRNEKGMALKNLVYRYCGEIMSKGLQCSFRLGEELTEEQIDYCRKDLEYLPIILKKQHERIKTLGLQSVIDTEMRMVPATIWLELSGIHYDDEKLRTVTIELQKIAKNLSYELYQAFGSSKFKLGSSPEMVKRFNEKGIPVTSINKEELAKFEDPLIDKYTEWREHYDLIIRFVKTLPKYRYNKTGRVYASFKQYGAKSGRFSCRFPNFQQQPSKYKNWRTIFTAEPGNKIVACDYSQIELRILGEIANEPEFINAYSKKVDLHKLTASKVFNVPIEDIGDKSRERNIAKPINFGLNYSMSSPGLIKKLRTEAEIELSKNEADAYISAFKKAYPAITLYLQNISQKGAVERELRNAAGRRLVIGQDKDENGAGRGAMNLPIQSLCADMVKEAIPPIQAKLEPLGVKFVNMVHDELVFECKADIADYVCNVAKEEMIKSGSRYLKKIPCLVDGKPSDYWEK